MANILSNGDFHAGGNTWRNQFYDSVAYPSGAHKAVVQEGLGTESASSLFWYVGNEWYATNGDRWRLSFDVKKIVAVGIPPTPIAGNGFSVNVEPFSASDPDFPGGQRYLPPFFATDVNFTLGSPIGSTHHFSHDFDVLWPSWQDPIQRYTFYIQGPFSVGDAFSGYGFEITNVSLEFVSNTPPTDWAEFTTLRDDAPSLTAHYTDVSEPPTGYAVTSWAWDFGDAGTSTLQNPSHTFAVEGAYTVTLVATATQIGHPDSVSTVQHVTYVPIGFGPPPAPPPPAGGHCVHYPAPYDTSNWSCVPTPAFLPTPAPPVPTWGEITVEWPNGCTLEAVVCWEDLEWDRPPSALCDLSSAYGNSVFGDGPFGLAAGLSAGIFPPRVADFGPTHYWQGKGVTKYEVLADGVVVATLNGHQTSTPGHPAQGPIWVEPAKCVTLSAGAVDWSSPRVISVRAYFNDVPQSVQLCYYFDDLACGAPSGIAAHCVIDTTDNACAEDFLDATHARKSFYTEGAPANQPTACGLFGGGVGGSPCTKCACCSLPHPGDPTDLCGIPLADVWDRWDYEAIDLTFDSPGTPFQCPIPFCEDFENCGSAPEDRIGSTSCAETGFYCSPTHVLEVDLGAPAYWRHEAISGRGPVYLAAVLWLPISWSLPALYSRDVFAFGITEDPDASNPYFEGIALRVETDGAANPFVYALGVWGNFGSTFNIFGTPTALCLGQPNCLQFRYWAADGSLPPSPSLYPIGTAIANGVEVGREVRTRTSTDPPHAEAVVWGAVEYDGDASDLAGDAWWFDDVCYGQTAWIDCACSCNPPAGDVYLSRAFAPEAKDPLWTPPSASGVTNLRGVSAGADGGGSPASPDLLPTEVDLGGARVKID